jgi:glycosyltransferase involved in cell wall biosynthesis
VVSHGLARARNLRERRARVPWPAEAARSESGDRVAVVIVNYGTRLLTAQLVYSIHRIVGGDRFAAIVVVDNGSRDGSDRMLGALARAGLVHLIRNRRHRYHGPGINQGISWLARRQRIVAPSERVDFVWVLDSDVLLLRRSAVADAVAAFRRTGAAILGQRFEQRGEDHELVALNTLMLDPSQVWRPPFPPFLDDGAPSRALQQAVLADLLYINDFPFLHHSYALHLGSGTLDRIADRGERRNRFYRYSLDHREPHYNEHPLGSRLRAAVLAHYDRDVGSDDPEALARACLEPALHTIPEAQPLPPVAELWRLHREGVDLGEHLVRLFGERAATGDV